MYLFSLFFLLLLTIIFSISIIVKLLIFYKLKKIHLLLFSLLNVFFVKKVLTVLK